MYIFSCLSCGCETILNKDEVYREEMVLVTKYRVLNLIAVRGICKNCKQNVYKFREEAD